MSKEAALRAMREAKFNARAAAGAKAPTRTTARPPVAPEPATKPAAGKAPKKAAPAPEAEGDALCGHTSMNGRTCTREKGHAAKSHRYS
ncbi:hypothetical protein [Nocardioides flavescens]|uniref:Uncharacterized protein n=1 Tax=Nocardioides flavescens TaxID=2691959 RepID=A0A6L7ES78_9ACTN|nr:hypothetical protein [Nocardioides flavescens]MXG88406.1 hypothetical protein [Nocardioides flavescens]